MVPPINLTVIIYCVYNEWKNNHPVRIRLYFWRPECKVRQRSCFSSSFDLHSFIFLLYSRTPNTLDICLEALGVQFFPIICCTSIIQSASICGTTACFRSCSALCYGKRFWTRQNPSLALFLLSEWYKRNKKRKERRMRGQRKEERGKKERKKKKEEKRKEERGKKGWRKEGRKKKLNFSHIGKIPW